MTFKPAWLLALTRRSASAHLKQPLQSPSISRHWKSVFCQLKPAPVARPRSRLVVSGWPHRNMLKPYEGLRTTEVFAMGANAGVGSLSVSVGGGCTGAGAGAGAAALSLTGGAQSGAATRSGDAEPGGVGAHGMGRLNHAVLYTDRLRNRPALLADVCPAPRRDGPTAGRALVGRAVGDRRAVDGGARADLGDAGRPLRPQADVG